MGEIQIAIIGQSGVINTPLQELAYQIGKEIAIRKGILLSGGRDGVMEAACRGAKDAGGTTVGILPGNDKNEGNSFLDVSITTGLDFDYRSLILIHSCDAVIMLGGRNGTLNELSAAYLNNKPIVVLKGSTGWSDRIQTFAYRGKYLDDRENQAIEYADNPREAVEKAFSQAQFAAGII